MIKSILKYLFSTLLAGGLLYWAFSTSHIKWQDIYETLGRAHYNWVALAIFIAIISHVLRALRWEQLLGAMQFYPGTWRTFSAVMIGYLANFIVPRMGEVSRCGSLTKTANIPFEKSFGTVITERIIDLVGLMVIVGLSFLVAWKPMQENLFPNFKIPSATLLIGLIIVGALGIILVYRQKNKILFFWNTFSTDNKIGRILAGWLTGIISIKEVESPFKFIAYTISIWVCYYANTYILLLAFDSSEHLGLSAGLLILVMGTFGMATPTQGGIGAYHKLVSATLVFYHLPLKEATILATFFHGTQMATILLFGGLSFIFTLFLPTTHGESFVSK